MLLDALGTLVSFADPAPALAGALGVGPEEARRAMRREIAFYRAHHDEAADRAGLEDLRRRCGEEVRAELGLTTPVEEVARAVVAAIAFAPFPEVEEVLAALRADGVRLVVVSNWDVSLHDVLDDLGLRPLLDGVLTSAEEGVAKPDPVIFARALARAGVRAADALHVGDSEEHDVAGARRAGVRALLLDRAGPPRPGAIDSLRALLPESPGS